MLHARGPAAEKVSVVEDKQLIEILLVEDNAADVRLLEEILKDGSVPSRLSVARDGEEGLMFLRRHGRFSRAPRPALIILDLNLPKKDGRELLSDIKRDPHLRCIPVLVLTSSNADRDVTTAYDLHANCYIIKPLGLDEFVSVVRQIESFWLGVAALPPEGEDHP